MLVEEQRAFSAAEMKETIERLVWARTGGGIRELVVEVHGSSVLLDGVTDTYYNKQLASHAVMDRFHGLTLDNNIDVC